MILQVFNDKSIVNCAAIALTAFANYGSRKQGAFLDNQKALAQR
jgi:hypothetical protein